MNGASTSFERLLADLSAATRKRLRVKNCPSTHGCFGRKEATATERAKVERAKIEKTRGNRRREWNATRKGSRRFLDEST
jgi:hypothetical protein